MGTEAWPVGFVVPEIALWLVPLPVCFAAAALWLGRGGRGRRTLARRPGSMSEGRPGRDEGNGNGNESDAGERRAEPGALARRTNAVILFLAHAASPLPSCVWVTSEAGEPDGAKRTDVCDERLIS